MFRHPLYFPVHDLGNAFVIVSQKRLYFIICADFVPSEVSTLTPERANVYTDGIVVVLRNNRLGNIVVKLRIGKNIYFINVEVCILISCVVNGNRIKVLAFIFKPHLAKLFAVKLYQSFLSGSVGFYSQSVPYVFAVIITKQHAVAGK